VGAKENKRRSSSSILKLNHSIFNNLPLQSSIQSGPFYKSKHKALRKKTNVKINIKMDLDFLKYIYRESLINASNNLKMRNPKVGNLWEI
jgi:hypothetical protein